MRECYNSNPEWERYNNIIPTDAENNPIQWDCNNFATIKGHLHRLMCFFQRTGYFEQLIRQGAVTMPCGKVVVRHADDIPFVEGHIADNYHDFYNPCPGTAERIRIHNQATGTPFISANHQQSIDLKHKENYAISEPAIDLRDRDFMLVVASTIMDSAVREEMITASGGTGRGIIIALLALNDRASLVERCQADEQYDKHMWLWNRVFKGKFNLKTFNIWNDKREELSQNISHG